jgi:hypothetical protein
LTLTIFPNLRAVDLDQQASATASVFLWAGQFQVAGRAARISARTGGRRAAAIYSLIATAKLNDIDPQAWLADVLARLPDYPAKRARRRTS